MTVSCQHRYPYSDGRKNWHSNEVVGSHNDNHARDKTFDQTRSDNDVSGEGQPGYNFKQYELPSVGICSSLIGTWM